MAWRMRFVGVFFVCVCVDMSLLYRSNVWNWIRSRSNIIHDVNLLLVDPKTLCVFGKVYAGANDKCVWKTIRVHSQRILQSIVPLSPFTATTEAYIPSKFVLPAYIIVYMSICLHIGTVIYRFVCIYLAMDKHDGAQQSPCATLSIDVQHAKYLQESDAPNGAGCEHLAIGADGQNHHRGHHND